ncbi:MAG: hypothetical protein M1315_02515 [Candidatus Thermoplasmatota archaeon]|nr:hypothetical protein [Candidatus Thermoplasmatota archaeon]
MQVIPVQLQIGQRIDVELDREEVVMDRKSVLAIWYHMGKTIYIELNTNKSMLKEIRKSFSERNYKTQLLSITRISRKRYSVEPTMVVVNKTA